VIQAIILLFLVVDVLLRKLPGLRTAKAGLVTTEAVVGPVGGEAA
jgi:hypothetical protein